MYNCSGILVVGRYIPKKYEKILDPASKIKNRRLDISHEVFFQKFKGIEGDIWLESKVSRVPTEDGALANIEDIEKMVEFYESNRNTLKCDLLFLSDAVGIDVPPVVKKCFVFCGYDIGLYASAYSYWSCIANEIVNGSLSQMQLFAKTLNAHFLFSEIEEASDFLRERQRMCHNGYCGTELEDIEAMFEGRSCQILEIYVYRDQNFKIAL